MYVISVSKSYSHRGNHRHRPSTKKQWYVYYLDEEGKLVTKRISALQAAYYKTRKLHRYKYICEYCGQIFLGLVRSKNQTVSCHYCGRS
jgi:hypothetical protein